MHLTPSARCLDAFVSLTHTYFVHVLGKNVESTTTVLLLLVFQSCPGQQDRVHVIRTPSSIVCSQLLLGGLPILRISYHSLTSKLSQEISSSGAMKTSTPSSDTSFQLRIKASQSKPKQAKASPTATGGNPDEPKGMKASPEATNGSKERSQRRPGRGRGVGGTEGFRYGRV